MRKDEDDGEGQRRGENLVTREEMAVVEAAAAARWWNRLRMCLESARAAAPVCTVLRCARIVAGRRNAVSVLVGQNFFFPFSVVAIQSGVCFQRQSQGNRARLIIVSRMRVRGEREVDTWREVEDDAKIESLSKHRCVFGQEAQNGKSVMPQKNRFFSLGKSENQIDS